MSKKFDEHHPLFSEYISLLEDNPKSATALAKIDEMIDSASSAQDSVGEARDISRLKIYKLAQLASSGRLEEARLFLEAQINLLEPASLVSAAEIAFEDLDDTELGIRCLRQAELTAAELELGERRVVLQLALWALAEILERDHAPVEDFDSFWSRLKQLDEHSLQSQTPELVSAWRARGVFEGELRWLGVELLKQHKDDPEEADFVRRLFS